MVNESLTQFRVRMYFSRFAYRHHQDNLEAFAKKYKNDINKNPEFRKQFQVMCNAIGVDPLACTFAFARRALIMRCSKEGFLGTDAWIWRLLLRTRCADCGSLLAVCSCGMSSVMLIQLELALVMVA